MERGRGGAENAGFESRNFRRRLEGKPRRGTESPPRPRPRAPGEIPPEKAEQGQPGSPQGRSARLLHADGLRSRPPARVPGAPLQQGGDSGAFRPATALGSSSKTLLSPRHWDLVSSLEPLVNLRSGSGPPSGTMVPQNSSKSLFRKVCTSRVQTWEGGGGGGRTQRNAMQKTYFFRDPNPSLGSPITLPPPPHSARPSWESCAGSGHHGALSG